MNNSKIIVSRRLSGIILFLSWLLLLAFPAFILSFSLESLFKVTQDTNSYINKSKLAIEMEMFQDDVEISHFLDRELGKFFENASESSLLDWAPRLADAFHAQTEISASGIIIHGEDTARIASFFYEPAFKKLISRMPKNLSLKYFASRNNQPFLKFFDPRNEIRNKPYKSQSGWNKLTRDMNGFWQRHFGLIAELPLIAGKTSQSISSKLGGPVYFYYHPVYAGAGPNRRVKAGVLLLIKGRAIIGDMLMRKSLNSVDKTLVRGLSFFSNPVSDTSEVDLQQKLSSFTTDLEGVHLQVPVPQNLAVHMIQRGGLYPQAYHRLCRNIPLLKVSLPMKNLEHPLKKHSAKISFLIRFLIGIGLVLCLRIYFFGFEIRAGVRQKVVIGILLVSFLPMTLLLASYQTWREFDQRLLQVEIENAMRKNSGALRKQFDSQLLKLQKKTLDLANQIGLYASSSKSGLQKFLYDRFIKTFAQDMFLDRPDLEPAMFSNNRNSFGYKTGRDEEFFRRMTMKIVIDTGAFGKSTTGLSETSAPVRVEGPFKAEPELLNSILNSFGRLVEFPLFANLNSYSVAKILLPDDNSFYGFITLRFNREQLVSNFASELLKKPDLKTEYSKFSLQSSIFAVSKARDEYKTDCLTSTFDHAEIEKQLTLACQINSSFSFNTKKTVAFIDYIPRFPMLIVTTANVFPDSRSGGSFSFFFLIYGTVLIVFIFNLFGKIYVEPIAKLAFLAERVGRGDLRTEEGLTTGDEFQDLKIAFDSMLAGVIQKERLLQFVSEDVANAVKSSTDENLQPGGERLEATIIFASIANFELKISQMDGDDLMGLLDRFISAGDKVARSTGGILDKVIENTLMFVYRSREEEDNHAIKACYAAILLNKELAEVGIVAHTGISSGSVLSGRIGSYNGKLDYTVIGDAVNMAARLKIQAHKATKSHIVIAPSTIRKTKGWARVKFIERLPIKGKSREYPIYELVDLRDRQAP